MTHLRIELNTTGIEEVSSAVIAKLYDIVHSGTLDNTSNLLGRLHTTATYLDYVDYLEGLFDGTNDKGPLYITANKYYQSFEDPEVQRILASTYGDGTGVTRSELANVSEIMDLFKGNTTITKFNEFKYFTGIDHDNIVWQADWFTGCTNLREITIPKNVKYIASNNGPFTNCSSLETVTFDPISSLKQIGGFLGCSSLTNISIPDSVLEIGDSAFRLCTSLLTFDAKNVTILYGNAFKQCSSLTSVTALNVTTIRNECFSSSGLVTLTYDPNKIVYLDSEALSCGTLVINDLSLPNLTHLGSSVFAGSKIGTVSNLGSTITSIPDNTFYGCNLLTSVTLPSQVTEIGSRAFYNCSSLTSIDLTSCTNIGNNAFEGCSSLSSINLSNLTSIPQGCFKNCTSLTSVDLSNITLISPLPQNNDNYDNGPFLGCTSLTNVIGLSNIDYIGGWSFTNCPNLGTNQDLVINTTQTFIGSAAFNRTNYRSVVVNGPNVGKLTNGYYKPFENMPNCTYFDISNTVVTTCTENVIPNKTNLETVIFPSTLSSLSYGVWAFQNNTVIKYFIILATTPPNYENTTYCKLGTNGNFYVPDNAVATYKSTWPLTGLNSWNIHDHIKPLSELPVGIWKTGLYQLYEPYLSNSSDPAYATT